MRSMPQSSYYDKQNRPTAALYRARQPYLAKNIMAGLALLGFVGGVCTWNISVLRTGQSADGIRQTPTPSRQSAKMTLATFLFPTHPSRPEQLSAVHQMLWFRTRRSRREGAVDFWCNNVTWNTTMHMGGVWRIGGIHYHFLGVVMIPEESDTWLDQIVQRFEDIPLITSQCCHVTLQI